MGSYVSQKEIKGTIRYLFFYMGVPSGITLVKINKCNLKNLSCNISPTLGKARSKAALYLKTLLQVLLSL